MRRYKSTAGIEFKYGDDMTRSLYKSERDIQRKRLKKIKRTRNESMYDEDGKYNNDDMTYSLYEMGIKIIRGEIDNLEGIYYCGDNDSYGLKENGDKDLDE